MKTKNEQTKTILSCKDHSVSGEVFELIYDNKYDMLVTTPQPKIEELPTYYQSEDYISHTDARRNWFEKVYQFVKYFNLKKKVKLINSELKLKGNLLDIGAGTGDFLNTARKSNWNIFGAEPDNKARALAKEKRVDLLDNTSSLENHFFDVITMWHVLEHVPDLKKQIKELKRLLKPGGKIFIAVPNYKSFDAKIYGAFWAAYDVPRHLWHFSKQSINLLMEEENLNVEKIRPMQFDSYYVSLLSEKYKTGNKNIFRAFYNGFRSNLKAKQTKEHSSIIYVIKNS